MERSVTQGNRSKKIILKQRKKMDLQFLRTLNRPTGVTITYLLRTGNDNTVDQFNDNKWLIFEIISRTANCQLGLGLIVDCNYKYCTKFFIFSLSMHTFICVQLTGIFRIHFVGGCKFCFKKPLLPYAMRTACAMRVNTI